MDFVNILTDQENMMAMQVALTAVNNSADDSGRKTPRPHQKEAHAAVLQALASRDRASVVMPCGSGKTLLQLWLAESLATKSVLVLVPSLALVSQSLSEWRRETSVDNVAYMAVCHDSTVDQTDDDSAVNVADWGIEVTTKPRAIRKFLTAKGRSTVKIIFCTYQSAHAFAAGLPTNMWIDLAIFDEAHRTAGKTDKAFAVALRDDAVRIRKRLFFTATPRHYEVKVKDDGNDAEPVYSMDDETIYGPVAYHLSYQEAVQRKIILPYKVIIPVITRETLSREMILRGKVVIDETTVNARTVACQVAIRDAMEKYDIRKAITFHGSIKDASRFTGDEEAGVARHLPEVACFHVNGRMSAGERAHILDGLRQAPRAVISNKSCLTEGVDAPSVDMVAFMSPKRSVIDITQAIGRAIRPSPGKTCGYVLIPLLVEQSRDETLEDALRHSDYGEIWNVLQTMLERDASIAKTYFTQKGCVKLDGGQETVISRLFEGQVEFMSDSLTLDQLNGSIVAHVLDSLRVSWETSYEMLKDFHAKTGHCIVFRDTREHQRLADFIYRLRQMRKRGRLSGEQIRKLDTIGFVWILDQDARWRIQINQVRAFKDAHGHCCPKLSDKGKRSVSHLVSRLRQARVKNQLPSWVVGELDQLGFVWSIPEEVWDKVWEENFSKLAALQDTGQLEKLNSLKKQQPKLVRYAKKLRMKKKAGELSAERIKQLDEIGFSWSQRDSDWESMFAKLVQHKKHHGHFMGTKEMVRTAAKLRQKKKSGTLSTARIKQLDEIGFPWSPRDSNWESMFHKLVEHTERHDHCLVIKANTDDTDLYVWAVAQRCAYHNGKLDSVRAARLNELGFVWCVSDHQKKQLHASSGVRRYHKTCVTKGEVKARRFKRFERTSLSGMPVSS